LQYYKKSSGRCDIKKPKKLKNKEKIKFKYGTEIIVEGYEGRTVESFAEKIGSLRKYRQSNKIQK
jgi:ribosomal protein L6P/L9E